MAMAGPEFRPGQYEFQCLHGMGEALYEQVVGPAKLDRPCRGLRAGRHARDAAGLPGAPAAGERRQQLVRQSNRRSGGAGGPSWWPIRCGWPASAVPVGAPQPVDRAGRTGCFGLGATQRGRARPVLRGTCWRRWASGSTVQASSCRPSPLLAFEAAPGPWRDCTNPADRRSLVGRCRDARPGGRAPRDCGGGGGHGALERGGAAGARPPVWTTLADRLEAMIARPARPDHPRGRRSPPPTRVGRGARGGGTFLRYYASRTREPGFDAGASLGPVVCIRPVELPAGDLRGPGSRRRSRPATRVLAKPAEENAADRGRWRCACCTRPASRARALQLLPGDGEVGAALVSDRRVGGVMFHRLHGGGRSPSPARWRRMPTRSAERSRWSRKPAGQNALVVDSTGLPEQVVVGRGPVGIRLRRAALLGAGACCACRRRAAERDAAHAEGARWRSCGSATRFSCAPMSGPVIGEEAKVRDRGARGTDGGGSAAASPAPPLPPGCGNSSFRGAGP